MSRRLLAALVAALVATVPVVVVPPASAAPAEVDLVFDLPADARAGTTTITVRARSGDDPAPGTIGIEVRDADDEPVTPTSTGPTSPPDDGTTWTGVLAAGAHTVSATFEPTDAATHSAATGSESLSVGLHPVELAVTATPAARRHQQAFSLSATATSGGVALDADGPGTIVVQRPVVGEEDAEEEPSLETVHTYPVTYTDGVATRAGVLLDAGAYVVTATFEHGLATHGPPVVDDLALTVTTREDTVVAPAAPARPVVGGRWVAPTAQTTSSRAATVAAGPAPVCSLVGADVSYDAPGTCTVTFSTTTAGGWVGTSVDVPVQIRREADVVISVDPEAPRHQRDFTITATVVDAVTRATLAYTGPGTITVSGKDPIPVAFSAGVATTGAQRLVHGTYTVGASIPAQGEHHGVSVTGVSLPIAKGVQAVTAPAAPTGAVVGGRWLAPTATVEPSGTSPVVTAGPAEVCATSGADVVYAGAGTCTVTFTAPASANLDEASATVSFPVTERTLALSLDVPESTDYGQAVVLTAQVTDTTTASPGTTPDAPVAGTFTITVDGVAVVPTVDADTGIATYRFSAPSAGSYAIAAGFVATPAGRYTTPTTQTASLVVRVAGQAVAASDPPTPGYLADVWQMSLTRGGSGSPVVLTSTTPTTCTLTGAVDGVVSLPEATTSTQVEFVGEGPCRIAATQAAVPGKYDAADDVIAVAVAKVPVVITLTVTPDPTVGELVVVRAAARAGGRTGSALHGRAVAGRGPVSITPGGTTVDREWFGGGELVSLRPANAGSHTVSASFVPTDTALYATPTVVVRDFTVAKASQTITVHNPAPSPAYVTQVWEPRATGGGSSEPVVISVPPSSPCRVVDVGDPGVTPRPQGVELTGTGTCAVSFSQAGDDHHRDAATVGPISVEVQKIPVLLTITSSVDPRVGAKATFYASASSALDGSAVPGTATFEVTGPTDRAGVPAATLPPVETWTGSSGRADVTALHSGTHDVAVTFRPAVTQTHFVASTTWTRSFAVGRGPQSIRFATPADPTRTVGGTWESGARSTATGLPVTGEVLVETDEPVCSVSGTDVTFERAGTCRVIWSQAGDDDWLPATEVTTVVDVRPDFTTLEVELSTGAGPWTPLASPTDLLVDRQVAPPVVENVLRVRAMGRSQTGGAGLEELTGRLSVTLTNPDGAVVAWLDEDATGHVEVPLPLASAGDYTLDVDFAPVESWYYSTATRDVGLTASRRAQAITPRVDVEGEALVGQVVRPGFTATSGLPVSYAVPSGAGAACRLTPDALGVEMLLPEPCRVTVTQPGDHAWAAAPAALHTVVVSRNPTTTTVVAPADPMVGEPTTVRASTTSHGAPVAGDFRLLVDGSPVGPAVSGAGPEVVLPWTPTLAGSRALEVRFTPPPGDVKYVASAASSPVGVARASTRMTVDFSGGTVSARVGASGAPDVASGTVRFSSAGRVLADVALVDGTAGLEHGLPATEALVVTAEYSGDANRMPVTHTGTRGVPAITATVTPAAPAPQGWYAAPVTVSFACSTTTAPLTTACPAPVVLSADAAAVPVTREVVATDGGRASVTTAPISIDRTAPTVRLLGPKDGGWYRGKAPAPTCEATDATSGLASCTLERTQPTRLDHEVVATAVDRAGNTSTARVRFQVRTTWISGARFARGDFVVRARSRIEVVAMTRGPQPQLMLPRNARGRPRVPGPPMVATEIEDGVTTWVARYRLPARFKKGQRIRLGVKDRSQPLQVVRARLR